MVNCASASGYAFAFSPLLLLDIFPVGPFKRLRADEKRQRSRSGKERGRARDFERRDDDDSPRKRERERIGIRPPKMRNEKKKKKNNEGQPRARFLPFSKKKRFTARASKKGPPELGFGGGGGGVVEEVCVFCGDSLSTIIVFSFFPFFRRLFSLWGENTHFLNPRVIQLWKP